MPESALLREAVDELYSSDPDAFVERRRALSTEAKRQGDAAAATEIAALRKPTRSAWTMNVLARSDPDAFDPVVEVGDQMREAERALDGERMRELSGQRRRLIDEITRKAFAATGQGTPSPALRDDVVATLTAAFADPEVADLLRSGLLLRPAQWDGFGSASRPDLALVLSPALRPVRPGGARAPAKAAKAPAAKQSASQQKAARAAEAAREKERRQQITQAEKLVTDAERRLATAEADEQAKREKLRLLKEEVAQIEHLIEQARRNVRAAKTELSQAQRRRDRQS